MRKSSLIGQQLQEGGVTGGRGYRREELHEGGANLKFKKNRYPVIVIHSKTSGLRRWMVLRLQNIWRTQMDEGF
ncbi:hypothetical protein ATANTOWER_025270 [Ataeniobius toweri]|uniref:Uncharacterized protein n=1 Tax=Ataeniobius toweri TaxID=208326 RepID=A0ABU7B227_9TELE|nr:hypothetical protein [Ataeniobius toweri]